MLSDPINLASFFVLGSIGWLTYKILIWPFFVSPLRKIPGPPPDSLIYGNAKALLSGEADGFVEPQFKWYKKYGNIVKYYGIFNKPAVFVADPKIIQEITLSKSYDFIKPYSNNKPAIALLGKGLVFAEGDVHKRQRKMMNPAFSHSNIKGMVPDFIRVTNTLIDLIKKELSQGDSNVNLTPYISKTTLDIIGLVGFSYEFNSLTSPNELAVAYDGVFNTTPDMLHATIIMLSSYISFVRHIPFSVNLRYKEACDVIHRESQKLIEAKYKEAESGDLKSKDLLSLLINNNKTLPDEEKLTYDELRNQIMTFLVAGHETTSVTTSWALYLLAHHPHYQDLLREELVKAYPDKSKFNPTYDEIHSLEFLNCVLKETLRIATPGTYGFITLGTEIHVGILAVQKSAEIWGPTAEEFDPSRWLDPALMKKINNYNYLPFLNGARGCIGNKVASAEAKIMLAMLIMNFVFKPIEGFQIRRRAFPTPKVDPYLGLDVSIVKS
ncbi:cytochrome P450 [Rhizophagus irregularis]|uniref:Cytochrome P450 n=1 Tax=Rhizophagus irregularis TaxID=588596 RepID=A0A2N1MJ96_9GLOM|nr:cytochrome P450 [Rhizophagus irregularis]